MTGRGTALSEVRGRNRGVKGRICGRDVVASPFILSATASVFSFEERPSPRLGALAHMESLPLVMPPSAALHSLRVRVPRQTD
jgi:hypothetical protein